METMENRIREHLEELFSDAAPSRSVLELKEEMVQNLTEKYRDLVESGTPAEEAYHHTISGIGDVSGLIREMEASFMRDPVEERKEQRKSALLTAIAVILYILCPLPIILFSELGIYTIGLVFVFVMAATATGLLVYNNMTKPRPLRSEDSMVEEFREWQTKRESQRLAKQQISGAIWSIAVAVYFIISFAFRIWHISWVVFIIALAVQQIVSTYLTLSKDRDTR
jgi:fatty acid desaturase